MSTNTPLLESLSADELPNKAYKVALFDIDGTLLGLDGCFSDNTRQEIHRIKALGIKTAVASGRPYFAARRIADALGLDEVGSFCAGAHLYGPGEKHTLSTCSIDPKLCAPLVSALRNTDLHYELYTDQSYYIEQNRRPNITHVHAEHLQLNAEQVNFDSIIGEQDIIKMIAAVDTIEEHQKLKLWAEKFPQFQFSFASVAALPEWLFANIVDLRASRELAFQRLLKHYQVNPDEVISFGDAHSDMVFIQNAGVGVAMGNADAEVQACADVVTKPVWDDGVGYALSRLIPS